MARYGRAQLGVDGNAAFALLGPNIQEGESEFVTIPVVEPDQQLAQTLICARMAWCKLKARLGLPTLSYYFGPSHPYGD